MDFKRKKKFVIYKIKCNINGKNYIGITGDFKGRIKSHLSVAENGSNTVFHKAIRKYGIKSFLIFVLDRANTWEEACKLEKYYIKKIGTKLPNGYNMTDGGEGTLGCYPSESVKNKIAESHIGLHAGEKHGCSKLTEKDVIEIRKRYKNETISSSQLSKEYGIRSEQICMVISGKSWGHVKEGILTDVEIQQKRSQILSVLNSGEANAMHGKKCPEQSKRMKTNNPMDNPETVNKVILSNTGKKRTDEFCKLQSERNIGIKNSMTKITESIVLKIRKLYNKGKLTQYQLAERFRITQSNVSSIVNRKSWTHI